MTQRKGDRRGRSDRDDADEDRDDALEDMTDETQLDMQENEYSEPAEIDDVAAVDDTMEEVTSE